MGTDVHGAGFAIMTRKDVVEEIEHRIGVSEGRIKLWVLGGIVSQLLIMGSGFVAGVFYLGQQSVQFESALRDVSDIKLVLNGRGDWMTGRIIWERAVEDQLRANGWSPPPYLSGGSSNDSYRSDPSR